MNNNNPPHTAPDSYRDAAETFAALQAECRQWQEDLQILANSDDLFKVRTANTWLQDASTRAIPKILFGRFSDCLNHALERSN